MKRGILRGSFEYDKVSYQTNQNNDGDKFAHQDIYESLIGFFISIGFIEYQDVEFKKHYECLCNTHHQFKSDKSPLLIYCSIYPNGFEIEYGHKDNTFGGGSLFFWSKGDDRRKIESYIETLRCESMTQKIVNYLQHFDVEYKEDKRLSDIEEIIKKEKENTHIHGPNINCLEDIKKYFEENEMPSYNCKDYNGKDLVCGEVKYFYNYNDILCRGVVYHNINNMWWAIVAGKRYNIGSHGFFDYNEKAPIRKSQIKSNRVKKLKWELLRYQNEGNYEKCIILRDVLKSIEVVSDE